MAAFFGIIDKVVNFSHMPSARPCVLYYTEKAADIHLASIYQRLFVNFIKLA